MSAIDLFRALGGAFAHRVRAALTVLGIVIGTGSIVLLASLLHGGKAFLLAAEQDVEDADVVEVHGDEPAPEQREKTTRPLSRADAEALGEGGRPLAVVAESSQDTYATYQGRKKRVAVVGASASTASLYRLTIARGRSLDSSDATRGARVCLIGQEIYDELVPGAELEGLRLQIDDQLFAVVGVLENKPMLGSTDSTAVWNRRVLVPETTYDAIYAPSHQVQGIHLRTTAAERAETRRTVRDVLLRRHFGVVNFALKKDESGGMQTLILTVIQVLLVGTGLLSLLASGINIMNVMLVTVSERRREIGLRRAIGATPRSVLVQFLLEAVGLSGAGAAVGVAAGVVLAWATAVLAQHAIGPSWALAIEPWSVALGVILALATGLVFGLVPAWRAAKVSPIEALRSE